MGPDPLLEGKVKRKLPRFVRFVVAPAQSEGGDVEVETPEVETKIDADTEDDSKDDADETGGETWDQTRAMDKIRKANAEAKSQRERAKAAEAKAGSADEAVARAEKAEAQLMRVETAVGLGLPVQAAKFLQGATPEDVTQSAEELLALFAGPAKKPSPSNRPKPNLRGGARPSEDVELDAKQIVEAALSR